METASHQKNVNKLEEVLKRQKERLEQIQGQFALGREEMKQFSPMRESVMTEDDPRGVQSASTNHLEKAYEDLEKEIQDLKHKLQQSVGLGSSQGHS